MADSRIIVLGQDPVSKNLFPFATSPDGIVQVEIAGVTSASPFHDVVPGATSNPTYFSPSAAEAVVKTNTSLLPGVGASSFSQFSKAANWQEVVIVDGTAASGTTVTSPITSAGARSLRALLHLTALQAANTLTLNLQWGYSDTTLGPMVQTTFLSTTALNATGMYVLTVCSTIAAVANSIAQQPVPSLVRAQLVGTGTYTAGLIFEWGA